MRIGVRLGVLFFLITSAVSADTPPLLQEEWSGLLTQIEREVAALQVQLEGSGLRFDKSGFDTLWKKIGPQAKLPNRPLIIMLLGPHNTGKSTFVNQIIGVEGEQRVSAVSAIGGSTKVPVVLLPEGFAERDLRLLFSDFKLKQWKNANDSEAPVLDDQHFLIWKTHPNIPASISIVDAPDIGTDEKNAAQTRAVINAADVVVFTVPRDSYKLEGQVEKLKEVGDAGKPVIFIFNKANFWQDPGGEFYEQSEWIDRIEELQKLAGIDIIGAFVIEYNPDLASKGRLLPFYSIGTNGKNVPERQAALQAVDGLEVPALRIRSELGALGLALSGETGLENFLRQVRETNTALSRVRGLLAEPEPGETAQLEWPKMRGAAGVAILEEYAKHYRGKATRGVRATPYLLSLVVKKGLAPVMKVWTQGKVAQIEADYRKEEFAVLRQVLAKVLSELEMLHQSGKINGRLSEIVEDKINAVNISAMQAEVQTAHEKLKLIDKDLRVAIRAELARLKDENPAAFKLFESADTVLAGLECMVPVGFALSAGAFVVGPMMAKTFATSLLSGPVSTAGSIATYGYTAPSAPLLGDRIRTKLLEIPLGNIHRRYAESRIAWLMQWLRENYLKEFYDELTRTANATSAPQLDSLERAITCAQRLERCQSPSKLKR